jgi:hypothetical protein
LALVAQCGSSDDDGIAIDGKVGPIVSLKDLRRASPPSLDVGPGDPLYFSRNSLWFSREVGTQEIYSLSVKWP